MAITKAFILGAGLGTRLRPLTDILPKPLVPVWNEPLVHHALRHCNAAGIQEFAINTHHLHTKWADAFPEGEFENHPITFFYEPELLETGGGIKNISSFIGNDSILIFNGDIITDIDLQGLITAHTESDNLATLAVKSHGPNCNMAVEDGKVIDIRHTLGVHPGTHQFTGIYCIRPALLDYIPSNQKISIIPAFLEALKLGKLGTFNADAASWEDIGTIDAYKAAHTVCSNKNTSGSFISPKATIASEAQILNSIIWNHAVVKETAELENCIVYSSSPVSGKHSNQTL